MLKEQLGVAVAAEFVHFQSVAAVHPARAVAELVQVGVEVDAVHHAAAAGQAQGELEVPLADHAAVQHFEFAVEARWRKTLAPREAVAEDFRGVQA